MTVASAFGEPNSGEPEERRQVADIRQRGFEDRVSVEQARTWIDHHARPLPAEDVELREASGRVVAAEILARADHPPQDRAAENGYAVRAAETAGASDYNPVCLAIEPGRGFLRAGTAALVQSGEALPAGADAILPFEAVQADETVLQVFGAVPPGKGVKRRAQHARTGAVLVPAGRVLGARELGLLACLGPGQLRAVRRPGVSLIIAGPKISSLDRSDDGDGQILQSLVARDGATISSLTQGLACRARIARALAEQDVDLILVAGRTGTGPDDEAPLALAEAGRLAIHGIALRPGGSAGMGVIGDVPVILLPGDPLACLSAYEMLAGPLVRALGGRDPGLPHAVREAEVGRKIVSAVGSVDLCQVRFVEDRVEPIGTAESADLQAAVSADGFVVIPATLEGYAPGARVPVRLYR